jgi:hypothetical protein
MRAVWSDAGAHDHEIMHANVFMVAHPSTKHKDSSPKRRKKFGSCLLPVLQRPLDCALLKNVACALVKVMKDCFLTCSKCARSSMSPASDSLGLHGRS